MEELLDVSGKGFDGLVGVHVEVLREMGVRRTRHTLSFLVSFFLSFHSYDVLFDLFDLFVSFFYILFVCDTEMG